MSLISKKGVASVQRIEAELKHLIQDNWDWNVRKLSDSDYAVVFPSKSIVETWSKVRGVELALHSIKATIEKSKLDPDASSILVPVWVKVSGIPIFAKTVEIVKEFTSTVGEPLEVDELSLLRLDPVKVKVNCRDPSTINCFVEIFINGVGYELKFEVEGLGSKVKGGSHLGPTIHPKKKDDEEDEDEEESSSNDQSADWEKLAIKFGGDSRPTSEHKSGGESNKNSHNYKRGLGSDGSVQGKEIVETKCASPTLPGLPLAFSYPVPVQKDVSPKESEANMEGDEGFPVDPELEVSLHSKEGQQETSKEIVVHTSMGPSLMAATLWPCLELPNTGNSSSKVPKANQVEQTNKSDCDFQKQVPVSMGSNITSVNLFSDDLVDKEDIDKDIIMTDSSASDLFRMSKGEEISEDWVLAKKKGGKSKVKEPQHATRKSNRIQDQGIPMQEKAAMLKSIQNLEARGNFENNPFNILNKASTNYLEYVAISCDITLGSMSESPEEVITAMQAQELVRSAIAQAELRNESALDKQGDIVFGDVSQDEGAELAVINNSTRGVIGFKMNKSGSTRLKRGKGSGRKCTS